MNMDDNEEVIVCIFVHYNSLFASLYIGMQVFRFWMQNVSSKERNPRTRK